MESLNHTVFVKCRITDVFRHFMKYYSVHLKSILINILYNLAWMMNYYILSSHYWLLLNWCIPLILSSILLCKVQWLKMKERLLYHDYIQLFVYLSSEFRAGRSFLQVKSNDIGNIILTYISICTLSFYHMSPNIRYL